MQRVEEMMRLQKAGDAVERFIVDEDGAEQSLLRLDIMRGLPEGQALFIVGGLKMDAAWRASVS